MSPLRQPLSLSLSLGLLALLTLGCVSEPRPTSPVTRAASALPPGDELAREIALNRAVHRPGSGHRQLGVFVGTWAVRVEARSRVDAPFAPIARGAASIDWVLDGRFLDWRVSLEIGSERNDVRGYLGYDVIRDEVQALWLSDLTTQMTFARGSGNPGGRGIVFASGQEDGARSVIRVLDERSFVIENTGGDPTGALGVLRRTLYARRDERAGP